jgi:hypothetical protein
MATVNKDFKIKSGLIVEGTTATVNGFDVLTKKQGDQDYIVGLIGGTATSANTANTVVKRDANGDFAAGDITADLIGNVTGTVSSLSNHNTDALFEGNQNQYFTNQRALDATSAAYDAAGSAATVAGDLTDHENATAAHGATGAVVGTTNTQTLTNKTIGDTLNFTGAGAMTINSDSHIVLTPAAGSSVKWGADVLATQAYADQAEADAVTSANSYTDNSLYPNGIINNPTFDLYGSAATAQSNAVTTANAYTDTEIAALVDSAPELLDTLNELAAAIGDNPNYATDLATSVGTKAPLASPALTGVPTAPTAPTNTNSTQIATTAYADQAASAAAGAAQANAESTAAGYASDVADDLAAHELLTSGVHGVNGSVVGTSDQQTLTNKTIDGGDNTLQNIPNSALDHDYITIQGSNISLGNGITLNTDDISENQQTTNQYFTDARAKDSAMNLLVNSNQNNIVIEYNNANDGLIITAENGVADSTTDDLDEGTLNRYFTDVRAVDALEAVVPNFTAVELNSVAKQVAATLSAPTAGIQVAYQFLKDEYRSAEYLVKVAYGNHTEISKVLLTLDANDNVAITEYGVVGTNGSASTISAAVQGLFVKLTVTTANNDSTVTVMGTLLK